MISKLKWMFKDWQKWFTFLVLLNISDVLLTVWLLKIDKAMYEFNQFVVFLVEGFGWSGALFFKVGVSIVAFLVYYAENKKANHSRFEKFMALVMGANALLFAVVLGTLVTIIFLKISS